MAKLVTTDLSSIVGAETTAITTINNNFSAVEAAIENTLSRDGTSPNTMSADIDLNGNDLLNVGTIDAESLTINGDTLTTELYSVGPQGDPGDNGWSPQFAVVSDSTRRVLQLTGWTGGTGTTPTTHVGEYVGSTGFVPLIANGVDIRGSAGAGTGDVVAANNGSDFVSAATTFANLKQAASTTATGVVELATDAETQTGTDTARAITPANLTAKEATTTHYRANTADRILTTDIVWSSMAEVTLTDAATITWDMSTGIDFVVTLAGNRTLGNPTNTKVGQRGRIRVVQDGTGSRTLTKSSNHKTVGGAALTLSTAAASVDYIDYDVVSSTNIRLSLSKAWS